jgi:hypothetical protein
MIKHVNFTGRRRINQSCAEIEVFDGTPRTFDAILDLSDTRMPPDAQVFLEAMCAGSSVVKRFPFGAAGAISPPADRSLEGLEGANVFFALKVVDNERIGRILGLAENIRPLKTGLLTATGRHGILPIDEGPLDQEIWKLDIREHEVFLIVNENIPDLKNRARWDPLFIATVYPAVVRMILAAAIDRGATADDEDENWPTLWLRFGQQLHPENEEPPVKEASEEESMEWIDDVAAAFARLHFLRDQFLKALPETEEEES